MWIDTDFGLTEGDVGFVVRNVYPYRDRKDVCFMQASPARTNMSNDPRAEGWCGSTNNVSRYAEGVGRVIRVTKRGDRALVQRLRGSEARDAYMAMGHPDLADEDPMVRKDG